MCEQWEKEARQSIAGMRQTTQRTLYTAYKNIVHFGALEHFFRVFFIHLILLLRLSATTVGWWSRQKNISEKQTNFVRNGWRQKAIIRWNSHLKHQAHVLLFGILVCFCSTITMLLPLLPPKLEKKIRNYCITLYLIYITYRFFGISK